MRSQFNPWKWAIILFVLTAPSVFFAWAELVTKSSIKAGSEAIDTLQQEMQVIEAETEGWIQPNE